MNKKLKIVVTDCYHDSDKGGGGIIIGTVENLKEICLAKGFQPEFYLMYRFSEDDPRYASAARLIKKTYPEAIILPAPISSRRGPGLHWISFCIKAFFVAILRLLFPRASRHPAVVALRDADIVVSKGGNFYRSWSRKGLADVIAMYLQTYNLLLSLRLKKKLYLFSHRFGPFYSSLSKKMMRAVLKNVEYLSCRESISKDVLIQCGIESAKVNVDCDLGFGVIPADTERAEELLKTYDLHHCEYFSVTTRPWFQEQRQRGDDTGYNCYIEGMAALCDYVIDTHKLSAALIVQNDGMHSKNEPDYPVLSDIRDKMLNKHNARILNEDFSAQELVSIYSGGQLTLGTRLHSCIFSFTVGTPAIAVAYAHKALGIMKMMNAEEYILEIEDLNVVQGKQMIDRIMAERDILSVQYKHRAEQIRKQLRHSMEQALFGQISATVESE